MKIFRKFSRAVSLTVLLFVTISCSGNSEISLVKEGFMKGVSTEKTIEEVFRTISTSRVQWSREVLKDERWADKEYSMISASMKTTRGALVVQFVLENISREFQLQGATIDGECINPLYLVTKMYHEHGYGSLARSGQ